MRKSYFLFLLLLLSVIGSVNAGTIVIPDNGSASGYVVGIQMYNSSEIYNALNGTNWYAYTPVITGIDDESVYLNSEKDAVRFSLPNDGRYPHLYDVSLMSVLSYNKMFYESRTSGSSTYSFTATKDGFVYFYGKASGGWNWDSGTVKLIKDGLTVTSLVAHYGQTHEYFDRVYVSEGSELNVTLSVTDSYTTLDYVLVCNDGDILAVAGSPSSVVYDLYYFTAEVYGEPSMMVYEGTELLGTTDSSGYLCISTTLGMHDYTFVKDGYYNVSRTVEILDSTMDINVDMESTHLPVSIGLTDSEGGLTSVNLYIGGVLQGTVGNNQDVSLPKGTHELIFEKAGYWNETRTVTVDETLTDLTIRMYPESVFFKISSNPSVIQTYSNSEVNIALNIDPNDYAYGVKLYLTGQEVLDVRDSSNVQISKQDSYYLLDDFSSDKTVNVKINSGTTLGTNSLAVRVTGYNSIGTEFVTDTTIDYEIVRLPLSLTVPNWCIGSNSLTVIETEGDSRTVTIKVEDSEGNIIYTDTYTLEGFETHKFNIDFEETGDYKLYIQSGDLINTYIDVSVNNPVTLETKTITANEGSTATATVSIENPFTEPQYYRITIEGDPLTNATRVDFSISPGSSKSQSISFTLLDELDYDSYSLPLKVYLVEESGMTEIYSDSVILNIGSSGSFIPFIDFGDDGIIDTVITLVIDNPLIDGIIIIAGLGIFVFSGKKKGKKPVKTIKKPIVKKGGKKGGK
ncbi:hypothetical protein HNP88_000681 [Methanococcus maripaludis]|uniref:PEGA domain-containing protein n=1 Tax=Methanococcus maripaludis TaxID=39152 RepID=A0A7J9NLZ4_METMI|nr:DUF3244 domain-containing protein [Methanococcus maripaludis]MBA2846497.1 hypothetical protein [Methanococcus maripaludis]